MASNHNHDLHVAPFNPPQSLKTAAYGLIALGVLTFVIGIMRAPERAWTSYLVAFFFFASLGLGGLFWAAIQNIAAAGWSVSIRRYSEAMTSFIPVILVGGLVLVVGMKTLYSWADPEQVAANAVIAAKTSYLNVGFFVVRLVFFTIGWLIFRKLIVGHSIAQDKDGAEYHTRKSLPWSIGFILFFALTYSLFSVDLLMSLLPTWYSTIFGVYCFSGLFQASLAALALIIVFMRRGGFVRGYVTDEHLHDVVKFMKAFTVFWAYIAFSQFLLIWYANIPEETEYYIMRSQHGWLGVSMALLIFRFIVPFIALLPRGLKRNENHVIAVSVLVLVMQYVDIWWMVYPNFFEGEMVFGFWEIGLFALFAGIFLACLIGFFRKNSVVAVRDPRMHEALAHHVTY